MKNSNVHKRAILSDRSILCREYAITFLYADDAKLFRQIRDELDCSNLNTAFESVHDWCVKW